MSGRRNSQPASWSEYRSRSPLRPLELSFDSDEVEAPPSTPVYPSGSSFKTPTPDEIHSALWQLDGVDNPGFAQEADGVEVVGVPGGDSGAAARADDPDDTPPLPDSEPEEVPPVRISLVIKENNVFFEVFMYVITSFYYGLVKGFGFYCQKILKNV